MSPDECTLWSMMSAATGATNSANQVHMLFSVVTDEITVTIKLKIKKLKSALHRLC